MPAVPPRPASTTASSNPFLARYDARNSTPATAPPTLHTMHDRNSSNEHVVDVELVPVQSPAASSWKPAVKAAAPPPTRSATSNIHTLNTPVVPVAAATQPPVRDAYSESLPQVNANAPYPVAFFSRNRTRWQQLLPNFRLLSLVNATLVACVIVFIVELIVGAAQYDGAFVSSNPMGGPSTRTLYEMGGKSERAALAQCASLTPPLRTAHLRFVPVCCCW